MELCRIELRAMADRGACLRRLVIYKDWLNGRGAVLQGRKAGGLVLQRPVPEVLRRGVSQEGYVELRSVAAQGRV